MSTKRKGPTQKSKRSRQRRSVASKATAVKNAAETAINGTTEGGPEPKKRKLAKRSGKEEADTIVKAECTASAAKVTSISMNK